MNEHKTPIVSETHESTVHRMLVICPHCGNRNWFRRGAGTLRRDAHSCLQCLRDFKIQEVSY